MQLTIKMNIFWLYATCLASLVLCFTVLSRLAFYGINNFNLIDVGILFLATCLVLRAFFNQSRKIEIGQGGEIIYKSWFAKSGVRYTGAVNLIYIPYIPIFNKVTIVGSGSFLQMYNISNAKEVKNFIDKI